MNKVKRAILGVIGTAGAMTSLSTGPVSAAAIVDVTAYWDAAFTGYMDSNLSFISAALPTGVDISCSTNLSDFVSSPSGCSQTGPLQVASTSAPLETLQLLYNSVTRITNNSGTPIPGYLRFTTTYSSYQDGGLGAQVDDPTLETARFLSLVEGTGLLAGNVTIPDSFIVDEVFCDVAVPGGYTITPNRCGLLDGNIYSTTFYVPMPAGEDASLFYRIWMNGTVQGITAVPEPATWAIFGLGLFGTLLLGRRKFNG